MTTTKALAVAVAACAALACVATAQSLVLQPEAQSALFTLAGTHDELEHTWQQYEALVLSKTRSTPLVLFFEGDDSAAACAEVNDDNSSSEEEEEEKESEDDDDADESEVSTAAQTCRTAHAEQRELLRAAMTTVARAYKASGLQILRVPTQFLPRMARYVRVCALLLSLLRFLSPRSSLSLSIKRTVCDVLAAPCGDRDAVTALARTAHCQRLPALPAPGDERPRSVVALDALGLRSVAFPVCSRQRTTPSRRARCDHERVCAPVVYQERPRACIVCAHRRRATCCCVIQQQQQLE